MKRIALKTLGWVALVYALSASAASLYAAFPSTGIKGYWKMDESSGNAADATGNGYTLTNNGSIPFIAGLLNNAADNESTSNSFFSAANNADFTPGDNDFTFQLWLKPESLSFGVIDRWNGGQLVYLLQFTGSQLIWYVSDGSTYASAQCSTFGNLSTGTWYCVHCGHDAANNLVWISVNGVRDSTSFSAGGNASPTVDFNIGGSLASNVFDGVIDEVGYWKTAPGGGGSLTTTQCTDQYNSGTPVPYSAGGGGAGTNTSKMLLMFGYLHKPWRPVDVDCRCNPFDAFYSLAP